MILVTSRGKLKSLIVRAVLACGGRLEVIVPSHGYAAALGIRARRGFEELRSRASRVLPPTHPLRAPHRRLAGLRRRRG